MSKIIEKVQEITECCICTNSFTKPKILSCIHTFCLDCLEKTARQRELNPGDSMQCPICRKAFVIPREGMPALQGNAFMERLVECVKLSKQPDQAALCDNCRRISRNRATAIPKAVKFCMQCHRNICKRCCEDHDRFEELENHQFIDVGSCQMDELLTKTALQYCEQHKKKELEMFCIECQQVMCMSCFPRRHKFHNCSDIDEAAEEFRKQISRDLDKIKICAKETSARIQEVAKRQSNFQAIIELTEKKIIERSNELKNLVDRHTAFLLEELAVIKQRETKQIESDKEESETQKMVIESFETYCMELKSKGSDAEMCRSGNALHLRANELQEVREEQIRQQFSSVIVDFESSNLEELFKKRNILGKIRAVSIRSSGKLNIPVSSTIWAVTKLQNRIYILCQSPHLIHVFDDRSPFTNQKQIKAEEIKGPVDMVRCEISKCLYVLDTSESCIWKMTTPDHRLFKWLKISSKTNGLSLTSSGHLMLLRCDKYSSLRSLEFYGSDAKLIRRLPIEIDLSRPQHAIEKPNGDIIIIHNRPTDPGEPWVISRLSGAGEGNQYQLRLRETSQMLSTYCHLALDEENNRLFVTDYSKNQVILFDSNSLDWDRVLLTEDSNRINKPYRLFYDKRQKQLIVGQTFGKVDIFEVQ